MSTPVLLGQGKSSVEEPNSPVLRQTDGEKLTEQLKRWGSMLPIVGSFFVPLVDHVLPNRHLQRVALYVQTIARRISSLEARLETLESADLSEAQRVLFEVGARDAGFATSDQRVEQIADIVVPGLICDGEAAGSLLALRTLAQLDDEEIDMLAGYGRRMIKKWLLKEPDVEQRKRDERLLLGGDRSKDPAHFARWQVRFSNLESLRLVTLPSSKSLTDVYLTTAGELLLHDLGRHPQPESLFALTRWDQNRERDEARREQWAEKDKQNQLEKEIQKLRRR